ncbi:MAG: DsbE family thiol:disulfide interchange protein [Acidiferrobacterales bacterium]|nr:DsbE family thiol:disulfide interchange protein [Acidiferrobacterales bacterium]
MHKHHNKKNFNQGKISIRFLAPLIAFLAIAILLGVGLTLDPRNLPSALINKPAPTFDLELLANPDETISPNDLKGKRWMLNVWASWCVGCRVEHPILNEIANNTDIFMVGLNYKDDPIKARQWLADRGDPYDKIPMDIAGDTGIDWGVYGVPETFVIDEEGVVIYKHTGPLDAASVKEILPLFGIENRSPGGA